MRAMENPSTETEPSGGNSFETIPERSARAFASCELKRLLQLFGAMGAASVAYVGELEPRPAGFTARHASWPGRETRISLHRKRPIPHYHRLADRLMPRRQRGLRQTGITYPARRLLRLELRQTSRDLDGDSPCPAKRKASGNCIHDAWALTANPRHTGFQASLSRDFARSVFVHRDYTVSDENRRLLRDVLLFC